ncbi:hypothetical protein [Methylorubrum populi]
MMRKLHVPVTLAIAALCGTVGAALGDADLAGSGVILAVLALVVACLPSTGRRTPSPGARAAEPNPSTSTIARGQDA